MDTFNRHSKYSIVELYRLNELEQKTFNKAISIGILGEFMLVESVPQECWQDYLTERDARTKQETAEQEKGKEPAKVVDAKKTILNIDPFGAKYSGMQLGDIFNMDQEWWKKALKELKNQYIRERMEVISEYEHNK